jgi:hypothetical protein
MKRIRNSKHQATLNLPTIQLEGSLFLPDQLEKAAQGRAQGQTELDYGVPKGVKLKDEYSRAFQIACAQWQHFAAQLERADVDAHRLTVNCSATPWVMPPYSPPLRCKWAPWLTPST